jgi:hypothetical protein
MIRSCLVILPSGLVSLVMVFIRDLFQISDTADRRKQILLHKDRNTETMSVHPTLLSDYIHVFVNVMFHFFDAGV